jgi:hypothetical protein
MNIHTSKIIFQLLFLHNHQHLNNYLDKQIYRIYFLKIKSFFLMTILISEFSRSNKIINCRWLNCFGKCIKIFICSSFFILIRFGMKMKIISNAKILLKIFRYFSKIIDEILNACSI